MKWAVMCWLGGGQNRKCGAGKTDTMILYNLKDQPYYLMGRKTATKSRQKSDKMVKADICRYTIGKKKMKEMGYEYEQWSSIIPPDSSLSVFYETCHFQFTTSCGRNKHHSYCNDIRV